VDGRILTCVLKLQCRMTGDFKRIEEAKERIKKTDV
jgi:hypothetical protein